MDLNKDWDICKKDFHNFLSSYFSDEQSPLEESMLYSLKQGKKFRPFLCYATTKIYSDNNRKSLAFAVALEMVHAFSLIHDDLPALDNDDYRRGEKTNHKVFGEAMAILAGDALLNEAFLLISDYYKEKPALALQLNTLLAKAIGRQGMIAGQALDIQAQKKEVSFEELKNIHHLKTGCLIEAAVLGAAYICGASEKDREILAAFGKDLGLAFQIADDLLEEKIELGSYVNLLGLEGAKKELKTSSQKAKDSLSNLSQKARLLEALIDENQKRHF